jgi:hypothetical protein
MKALRSFRPIADTWPLVAENIHPSPCFVVPREVMNVSWDGAVVAAVAATTVWEPQRWGLFR